jgi:hypothetical protein
MVTNSPFSPARSTRRVDHYEEAQVGLMGQAMLKVRQSLCGLHGHDSLLHFEHDRMFLRCTSCGHETPGWSIGHEQRTEERFNDGARPVAVAQLMGARKIA